MSNRENLMLEDLCSLLESAPLVEGTMDSCTWIANPEGIYTVQSAYMSLQGTLDEVTDPIFRIVWGPMGGS